jgi:hypothetical protein
VPWRVARRAATLLCMALLTRTALTIPKLALALSIVALALAGYAVSSTGTKSSTVCGRSGWDRGSITIACNGHDAPPSRFGTCTPMGMNSGVMYWDCKPN